ncbi:hypothetical protein [Streptomyces cavernae]|uniref:hypothetical protein n=1 Tax=Streptomyces cavernae TaxID=2259034 RepID=UPI0012D96315|nr:hypothetical protein [Streptomyces cavernae]
MNTASNPATTSDAPLAARQTFNALYAQVRPHRCTVALGPNAQLAAPQLLAGAR